MEPNHWMDIGLIVLPIVAAILAGGMVFLLGSRHPPKRLLSSCREFAGMVKVRTEKKAWYQRQEEQFVKWGVSWHLGKKVNPLNLLILRILLAALGVWLGFALGFGTGILPALCLGAVFFWLPKALLPFLNQRDNEKMLPELRMIYHCLGMQIRSGVYVTDALAECYASVQESRLRQALLDLAGDLVMNADIFEALNRFQKKFENRYIDSLCITILQAMESGQAVELLGDLAQQVRNMETAVLARRKGKLDRSLTFYQLGMLAAVMMVALYSCVTYMLSSAILY